MKQGKFQGSDYVAELDYHRLKGQILRIFNLMSDGQYRTLREISDATGDGESSVSAQLRNLRKDSFGNHTILKRRRGDLSRGLFEYRLVHSYSQLTLPI